MGFLKRITNFSLPSLSASFLLLCLILFLNPFFRLNSMEILNLFFLLVPFYSVSYFLLIFLLTEFTGFLFETKFVKRFFDVKLIAFLLGGTLLIFGILFLFNSRYFSIYIPPSVLKNFKFWSIFLIFSGLLSFLFLFRRKVPSLAYLFFYLLILSLLFLSSRQHHSMESSSGSVIFEWTRGKKVTVLEMTGLSLDFIVPLTAEKKLPNFSYIMENGSWVLVRNFRPHDRNSLFATFETGKYPYKHMSYENCYKFKGNLTCLPLLPRFVFLYKLESLGIFEKLPFVANPRGIISILNSSKHPYFILDSPDLPVPEDAFLRFKNIIGEFPDNEKTKILLNAFILDEAVVKEKISIKENYHPFYFHVFLSGLDTVEHYFWKYARPERTFLAEETPSAYSKVIERYYDYYDSIIGATLSLLKDNEILLVYSPHGMSALPLWKRILNFIYRTDEISAYHDNAPEGIAIFYGSGVGKNGFQGNIKIVDLAPTLLYLMGFPIARDMDGNVVKKIIDPVILQKNPLFFVPSFQGELLIKKKE